MFKFVALLAFLAVANATYVYQTNPVVHHQNYHYQKTVPVVHYQTPTVYHHQTVPQTYQYHHSTVHHPVATHYQTVPVVAAKTYQTVPVVSHYTRPAVVYSTGAKTVYKPVEQHGYQYSY